MDFAIPYDSVKRHSKLLLSVKAGCICLDEYRSRIVATYYEICAAARERGRDPSFAKKYATDENN